MKNEIHTSVSILHANQGRTTTCYGIYRNPAHHFSYSRRLTSERTRGVPISEASCAVLGWAIPQEATDITQARSTAPRSLLSRIHVTMPHPRPTGARALGIAADIIPGRNQGSQIAAITNPCNHAAPRPKEREPSGDSRHDPRPAPRLPNCRYHESMRPCPPCPRHVPRGHGIRGAVRP